MSDPNACPIIPDATDDCQTVPFVPSECYPVPNNPTSFYYYVSPTQVNPIKYSQIPTLVYLPSGTPNQ